MSETRPLRRVTGVAMRVGRGSVLGGDTFRRLRWYDLTLECGHLVQRNVKYVREPSGERLLQRSADDALPPPKRARCDSCTVGA